MSFVVVSDINMFAGATSDQMLCTSHLLVLVLIWRSVLSALQLRLDEVRTISACPDGVNTCDGQITSLNYQE
jgi:hypothetical protein